MNSNRELISKLESIKSRDPSIKIESNKIHIRPNYLNYPFLINLIALIVLIYSLFMRKDFMLFLVLISLILVFLILIATHLYYNNTVVIDPKEEEIAILPFYLFRLIKKGDTLRFNEIKPLIISSNFWSTGNTTQNM